MCQISSRLWNPQDPVLLPHHCLYSCPHHLLYRDYNNLITILLYKVLKDLFIVTTASPLTKKSTMTSLQKNGEIPKFCLLSLFNLDQMYLFFMSFLSVWSVYFLFRVILLSGLEWLCCYHSFHPNQVFKFHVKKDLWAKCIKNHRPLQ